MTNLKQAAQQALEYMEAPSAKLWPAGTQHRIITALRAALAEPVQEPVAYIHRQGNHFEVSERHLDEDEKARGWTEEPLYAAPPQRKPLTEERNFCPRCGKRTNDIHTCTPPQEERFCDTHCTWADHAPGCVRVEPEPDSSGRMASHDPA